MEMEDLRRWIRLKGKTIDKAREACLSQGDIHHQKGRSLEGEIAKEEWQQAEEYHAAAKDIRDAKYERVVPMNDESVRANDNGHNQIVRTAPSQRQSVHISERTLSILAFALSLASLVIVLFVSRDNDRLYRHIQEYRVRVEDAEMAAHEVNPNFKPVRQPKEHE